MLAALHLQSTGQLTVVSDQVLAGADGSGPGGAGVVRKTGLVM